MDSAFDQRDATAVEALCAPDLIVNAPINRIVTLANAVARIRSGQIEYSAIEVKLEFAGVRGDSVVLMGEEVVTPAANTPHAGKTVHRRFTDIWKQIDGNWKIAIRHATITSVE